MDIGNNAAAAPSGAQEFRRGWGVVLAAMLGIGLGLSPVPFYTIGMLAPELHKAFGWEFSAMMVGLPIMTLGVLIVSPLVGLLADRYGVRRVTLISIVLFSLSFMSFALNNGAIELFYLNWALMAVFGAGTLPITWTRAVNNRFDLHKGLALGLSLLGTGIFGFLVKPLTAWLIADHGWRAAYVVVGLLPLLISLPVALLAFHDVDGKLTSSAERRAAQTRRAADAPGLSFRAALRDHRFWLLALAFVLISFAVGGLIPNMENILKVAGFAHGDIIALVSLIGLSVIVGRIAGGWLIDRLWAPGVAVVMISLPALACYMLTDAQLSTGSARIAIVLIGMAAGIEYDLMAFLVARYFGMKSYSAIYGAQYGFFAFGAGLAPVVFGKAFDKTGSYQSVLMLSAVFLILGTVALLGLGRYRNFDRPNDAPTPGAELRT
ncbi:MAG: MFS transporter [Comamonadaceae bacterium]|jgi:MFS family permease|nr:MFS transporter [Comamonadaceae bacterium]